MINYKTIVTLEEVHAHGFKTVDEYLKSKYHSIKIDKVEKFGNNIHVDARIEHHDYIPQTGKHLEYVTLEEIRKQIQQEFL